MASLTKIMTALVSIMLSKELNLDPNTTYFTVSNTAAGCCGTTAYLVADQKIKINDLLYALMLPSGNDAALTLAENFGQLMRGLKRICPRKECTRSENGQLETQTNFGGSYVATFVKEMNRVAKNVVHLRRTNYANPHGLADRSNHSTAFEQALLASFAMKIPEFAKIVNTR
jgi:serine-type D-Ala-D-Ala carboxypeptidase (penicillin-binding protein 5/6)